MKVTFDTVFKDIGVMYGCFMLGYLAATLVIRLLGSNAFNRRNSRGLHFVNYMMYMLLFTIFTCILSSLIDQQTSVLSYPTVILMGMCLAKPVLHQRMAGWFSY